MDLSAVANAAGQIFGMVGTIVKSENDRATTIAKGENDRAIQKEAGIQKHQSWLDSMFPKRTESTLKYKESNQGTIIISLFVFLLIIIVLSKKI